MNIKFLLFFLNFFLFFIFGDNDLPIYYTIRNEPSKNLVFHTISTKYQKLILKLFDGEILKDKIYAEGNFFELPDSNRYIYHIPLSNLDANTIYDIHLFHDNSLIAKSKFQTLPENLEDLKIAIGGDLEIIHIAGDILKKIAEQDHSVIFFGGDYPKDVCSLTDFKKWDEWLEMTTKLLIKSNGASIPWVMAIGNNEVFGSFNQPIEKAPFFHEYFLQSDNGLHYFDIAINSDFHLIVLDSGLTATHDGVQKKWLEDTLQKNSSAEIKVALYHVPIYPSVRFSEKTWFYRLAQSISRLKEKKSIANRLFSPQSREGFLHWSPLFDKYNLTCAFEHHEHSFKRSKKIKDGKISKDIGTYYLGDGALSPNPQFTPLQKFCDYRLEKSIGHIQFFWLMTFQKNTIDFLAISSYGKSIDQFSIQRKK